MKCFTVLLLIVILLQGCRDINKVKTTCGKVTIFFGDREYTNFDCILSTSEDYILLEDLRGTTIAVSGIH